ncbi:ABC transporter ATP-binding protein [Methylobrevis pamukkalensis]|uniref:Putative ABC transporter ATP-binding protein n=1 Tax=Methylobrevis pamukkalensis TaxID=1439726 RepID=A0A1E3H554_9HYPH|nr:putative ABC transporter ATP-binding protein [Methylobrevis pamukkalensis]
MASPTDTAEGAPRGQERPVAEEHRRGDETREAVIRGRGLTVGFGGPPVLENLDIDVWRGEILGVVGGSGTGKSVLLRTIIGLNRRQAGRVEIFDQDLDTLTPAARRRIGQRWGVLFQQGALFSSLTVLQNVAVPIREHLRLSDTLSDDLARLKIELVGLPAEAATKYPSELSGGMIKRAALARALALDPDIVFLDEPTAGLDPIGAANFDLLIRQLRDTLGLTVFMVTHDLDSLVTMTDRIVVLGNRKVLVDGTFRELRDVDHPWIQEYFNGIRASHYDLDKMETA